MGKRKPFSAIVSGGIMPPMEVALFHDRTKLKKRLAERGHEIELLKGFPGQTFSLSEDGAMIHFVLLELDDGIELCEQLALLAHEGTHVASHYLDSIGEEEPAEEWAYAVQSACSALFDMHLAWREGRSKQ